MASVEEEADARGLTGKRRTAFINGSARSHWSRKRAEDQERMRAADDARRADLEREQQADSEPVQPLDAGAPQGEAYRQAYYRWRRGRAS